MATVAGKIAPEITATRAGATAIGEGNSKTANIANSTARNKKKAKGAGEPEYSWLFFSIFVLVSSILRHLPVLMFAVFTHKIIQFLAEN
jgi:hypothetical protein